MGRKEIMKLSQAVVVVNEFTIKTKNGGGTRGATPGDYVLRYMAREGASEAASSALVQNVDSYVTKYMARDAAAESASPQAPKRIRRAGGLGGMAFSEESLSLSEEDLKRRSKAIQDQFDRGHTVLKTVLSFDTEYLKETGVVSPDFEYTKRGDFKGQVDQIRLREAVCHGVSKIAPDFDDLRYVGVIQMDTAHVHCHLALCDFGRGNLMSDGTQRGKLTAPQLEQIKRGVDLALDETKDVQYMHRYADMEKRNVKTALKRYTYEQLLLYGAPQKLLTHLPEDTRLWRADSNRKEMKAANRICRDYVGKVLSVFPDAAKKAKDSILQYAQTRSRREGLSVEKEKELYEKGEEQLTKDCMNSVYQTLASVPSARRKTATPLLDLSAEPSLRPDFQGGLQDMVYRMGSYGNRFLRHRKQSRRMMQFMDSYEKARDVGQAAPGSEALYDFFRIEQSYHEKVMEKYSYFLFFAPPSESLSAEFEEIRKKAGTVENFRRFLSDRSAAGMLPEQAETYGRDVYGVYGGRFLSSDKPYLERRFDKLAKAYEKEENQFKDHLAAAGVDIQLDEKGRPMFLPSRKYRFEDIRSLDLHELRGDFYGPLSYDKKAESDFLNQAEKRKNAYDKACQYLDQTGQSHMRRVFEEADIRTMADTADRIRQNKPVPPATLPAMDILEKKTISLDLEMHEYLSNQIEKAAEHFRLQDAAPEDSFAK